MPRRATSEVQDTAAARRSTAAAPARRPVGRPADTDSADTRRQLLVAAIDCFSTRGLARTTLRDISHAAGLTSGTLYFHFATKEALYIAAYAMAVDEMYAEYEQAIVGVPGVIDRLEAVLDRSSQLMEARPALQLMVLRAWVEHIDHQSLPLPIPPRVSSFLDTLVRDAVARGEIDADRGDELRDVYRTMMWGVSAVAPTRMDDIPLAIAGLKLMLRDRLLPRPSP
jgi:AcrR family transcriptional regulator